MSIPIVAIVGRPNVGKSSLFNMICRHRIAIVDPTPGVTRDRVFARVTLDPPTESPDDPARTIDVVDTGGFGVYSEGNADPDSTHLRKDVEFQIGRAIESADVILFVIDAQTGLAPLDFTVAELLRRMNPRGRVVVVANKVDDETWMAHAADAARLGFGEAIAVSATSSYNRRRFYEALRGALPERGGGETERPESELMLAIVGKRNAGKSTLVNALAGEPRVITSEIEGTTRDSVDVHFEINGRSLTAIDTAGVRKARSLAGDIEYYSHHRALRSVRRADVVALLIDATVPISQVDKKLTNEIQAHFKPCVIVVNKWDLVEGKKDRKGQAITPEHYLEHLTKELRGLDYAPCVFISALKKEGISDVAALAFNLHAQASHRMTTAQVNAMIRGILEKRGPTSRLGKQAKVLYASQVATNPPTIVLVVNHQELFDQRYQRYLMNRIRDEAPFSEVPIRILYRDRKRKALADLKADGREADLEFEEQDETDAFDEVEMEEEPQAETGPRGRHGRGRLSGGAVEP